MLSALVRPITRCCSSTESWLNATRSCTQRIASTWLPPSPAWRGGTSATSAARRTGRLAVPSMKPVRSGESRPPRYVKPGCSAALREDPELGKDELRAAVCSWSSRLIGNVDHRPAYGSGSAPAGISAEPIPVVPATRDMRIARAGQAVTTRISLVMPPTPSRRATSSNAASLSNWCLTSPFSVTQPSVTLTSILSWGTSTSRISV